MEPLLCVKCGRPRWSVEDEGPFCLFMDSLECIAFVERHPGYRYEARVPTAPPVEFPGLLLSDDETKVVVEALEDRLALLRELREEQAKTSNSKLGLDTVAFDARIEEIETLVARLGSRLELLCTECGVGPEHWCKMSCNTRRYGPASKGITIPIKR